LSCFICGEASPASRLVREHRADLFRELIHIINYKKRKDYMKKIATVKNDFGVAVKKCCMSCAHRDCTRLRETRFCNEHHKEVGRYDVCKEWQMSDQLKMVGRI
jgi:hypothetical protein